MYQFTVTKGNLSEKNSFDFLKVRFLHLASFKIKNPGYRISYVTSSMAGAEECKTIKIKQHRILPTINDFIFFLLLIKIQIFFK